MFSFRFSQTGSGDNIGWKFIPTRLSFYSDSKAYGIIHISKDKTILILDGKSIKKTVFFRVPRSLI